MAKVSVYNMEGKEVGNMDLNDAVFGVEINEHLVHMAVVQQLANNRQGTQKAKTRSEVSGGGRKPWRQKGTGHARQGSTRSPQWTGGGTVFAPVPRDYSFKLNKKEKRAALKSVLTSKVQENKFIVVDELKLDEIKTKKFAEVMNNLKADKALVILGDMDTNVIKSAANIATVKTTQTSEMNVFDVLKYDTVVATKAAAPAEAPVKKAATPAPKPVVEPVVDITRLFVFDSLEKISNLARILNGFYNDRNFLYKNPNKSAFYLVLHKGHHSPEDFNKVCNILSEYASTEKYSRASQAYFDEHFLPLIKEQALQVLAEI